MSSPKIRQDTTRDMRQQAAASVAQDMSSVRLRILADLMESRKKAEAHEQEFLKTIHSENAAFSKVVSLFEESIDELRCSIGNLRESAHVNMSEYAAQTEASRVSMMVEFNNLKQKLSEECELSKEAMTKSIESFGSDMNNRLANLDAEKRRIYDIINELESRLNDEIARLSRENSNNNVSVFDKLTGLEAANHSLSKRLDDWSHSCENRAEQQVASFLEMIREHEAEITKGFEYRLVDLQRQIEDNLDKRLATFQTESNDSTSLLLSERMDSLRDQMLGQLRETGTQFESRCNSIETCISVLPSKQGIDESVLQGLEERLRKQWEEDLSCRMSLLVDQVSDLDSRISARFGNQESSIRALASTGYFYDWTIRDAKSKLHGLGVMSTGGKFVSSEMFSIGPYSNLQLRLYPVSSSLSNSSPSVWLIHSPSGTDQSPAALPVYVDLGIGRSKRALCRMKKVQELFGHWVWEGSGFDKDFISKEIDVDGSLIVSVEISMRQWLAAPSEPTMTTNMLPVESLPESPMSAYTFAGGRTTPQLPLRPMSTNPFEKVPQEPSKSALTPRRMSWAMFGGDEGPTDEAIVPSSNPFSS